MPNLNTKPVLAVALIAALAGPGCITAYTKWKHEAKPAAIGMAMLGDGVLALAPAITTAALTESNSSYFWLYYLGVFTLDMSLFLGSTAPK